MNDLVDADSVLVNSIPNVKTETAIALVQKLQTVLACDAVKLREQAFQTRSAIIDAIAARRRVLASGART